MTSYPLAGSAPRQDDPDRDAAVGHELRTSAKDLIEHRYVVEHIEHSCRLGGDRGAGDEIPEQADGIVRSLSSHEQSRPVWSGSGGVDQRVRPIIVRPGRAAQEAQLYQHIDAEYAHQQEQQR